MNALSTVHFYDQDIELDDFSNEILAGLSKPQKTLPPKFFYDERGSQLFTEITRQPEYYPTRTETKLLSDHAGEISELIGEDFLLIEYGSGSSEKIRILLDSLRPSLYAPLDISRDYLAWAAESTRGWRSMRHALISPLSLNYLSKVKKGTLASFRAPVLETLREAKPLRF